MLEVSSQLGHGWRRHAAGRIRTGSVEGRGCRAGAVPEAIVTFRPWPDHAGAGCSSHPRDRLRRCARCRQPPGRWHLQSRFAPTATGDRGRSRSRDPCSPGARPDADAREFAAAELRHDVAHRCTPRWPPPRLNRTAVPGRQVDSLVVRREHIALVGIFVNPADSAHPPGAVVHEVSGRHSPPAVPPPASASRPNRQGETPATDSEPNIHCLPAAAGRVAPGPTRFEQPRPAALGRGALRTAAPGLPSPRIVPRRPTGPPAERSRVTPFFGSGGSARALRPSSAPSFLGLLLELELCGCCRSTDQRGLHRLSRAVAPA